MGVRQPGVKWNDGRLDSECNEKAEHDPQSGGGRHLRIQQLEIIECQDSSAAVVDEYQRKNCHQHEQTAALGENEELDRCIQSLLMAPDRNQEIHRHQHQLPEEEKQKQVQRKEYADRPCQSP